MTRKKTSSRKSGKSSASGIVNNQSSATVSMVDRCRRRSEKGAAASSRSNEMRRGHGKIQEGKPSTPSQSTRRTTRSSQGKVIEEVGGPAEGGEEEEVKDSQRTVSVDITDTPTAEEEELHRELVNGSKKRSESLAVGERPVTCVRQIEEGEMSGSNEHEEHDCLTSDNESIDEQDRLLMESLKKKHERKKKEKRRCTPKKRSLSVPSSGVDYESLGDSREDAIDDRSHLQGSSYERSTKNRRCGDDQIGVTAQPGSSRDDIDEIVPVRRVGTAPVIEEYGREDHGKRYGSGQRPVEEERHAERRRRTAERVGSATGIVDVSMVKKKNDDVDTPSDEPSAVTVSPSASGKKKGRKVKVLYDEAMLKILPELKERFNTYTVQSAIMSSVVAVCCSVIEDGWDISKLVTIVDGLFCCGRNRPVKTSSTRSVDCERMLLDLHEKCLKNSLIHSLKGFAGRRIGQGVSPPQWLSTMMIDPVLISDICNPTDNGNRKTRMDTHRRKLSIVNGKGEISKTEESRYVLEYVHPIINVVLNAGRKSVRRSFTKAIGYLFVEWHSHGARSVSQDVRTMWIKPFSTGRLLRLSDVPDNATIKSSTDADQQNYVMYEKLVKEQEEMQVIVQHDVNVVEGRASSKQPLKRMVSMIDVALGMLKALCGFRKTFGNTDVLKYHSQSLRTVYVLAIALRSIVGSRTGESLRDPSGEHRVSENACTTPTVTANNGGCGSQSVGCIDDRMSGRDQEMLSECFASLISPPSDITRILGGIVDRVPAHVYRRLAVPDPVEEDAKSIDDDEEVQQDEDSDGDEQSGDNVPKLSLEMLDDDM